MTTTKAAVRAAPALAAQDAARSAFLQRRCDCGSHLSAGGKCAQCGKGARKLQRKLAVGAGDSPLEAEADRIAAQVLAAPGTHAPPQVQRAGTDAGAAADTAPASVDQALAGSGQALHAALAADMGQRFGHNFSRVRVHADATAARSARDINAHAYTVGHDIVFGAGRYAPDTPQGRHLLAHELTHVIQQAGGASATQVRRAVVQEKPSASLPTMRQLLRKRGFFESGLSEADTHQVLQLFKAMPAQDLRDTVRALEEQDKDYVERLLTHIGAADMKAEFETLRAIKNARVWKVETKGEGTTTNTEVVGSCSPDQFRSVAQAANVGLAWLNAAIGRVDAYIAAPADAANAAVGEALKLHFHSTGANVLRQVRARLANIRGDLQDAQQLSIECHGVWDPECAHAGAYAPGKDPDIVLCGLFFGQDVPARAELLVHETAHIQGGGMNITDRAYTSDRMLAYLSTAEALTNAESYGLLVQQLGTGQVQKPRAPRDTEEDCPPEWWAQLQSALAAAQRWNRNLQVVLDTLTPKALQSQPNWSTGLGGATKSHIDKASKAVNRVASALDSPVSFECEPDGGGRCDTAATYWYAAGDLHVCPKWKAQASEAARVQSLLAGLYGYVGDVGDDQRRTAYAQLAAQNNQGWAAPSLGQVLGAASTWSPDHIGIDVRPIAPKGREFEYSESGLSHERLSADLPLARLAPAGAGQAENFRIEVRFRVDVFQQGRPFPFMMPAVGVSFRYASLAGNIDDNRLDLHPRYRGDGQALRTFGPQFAYRIGASGTMTMRFELKDPDTNITRVYDDTLQLAVAPAEGATP
jgi:hypothetical protein